MLISQADRNRKMMYFKITLFTAIEITSAK